MDGIGRELDWRKSLIKITRIGIWGDCSGTPLVMVRIPLGLQILLILQDFSRLQAPLSNICLTA